MSRTGNEWWVSRPSKELLASQVYELRTSGEPLVNGERVCVVGVYLHRSEFIGRVTNIPAPEGSIWVELPISECVALYRLEWLFPVYGPVLPGGVFYSRSAV